MKYKNIFGVKLKTVGVGYSHSFRFIRQSYLITFCNQIEKSPIQSPIFSTPHKINTVTTATIAAITKNTKYIIFFCFF